MSAFVVDASIAVKWVVSETDSDRAMALARCELFAPDLLVPECANVLWKKVRRGEMDGLAAHAAARVLERARIVLLPMRGYWSEALRWAVLLDHAVYDCVYLAVAIDRQIPFVSADARFQRKVTAYGSGPGVQVLGLEQALQVARQG